MTEDSVNSFKPPEYVILSGDGLSELGVEQYDAFVGLFRSIGIDVDEVRASNTDMVVNPESAIDDSPIALEDFQKAALAEGMLQKSGTRLFHTVTQYGKFYPLAKKIAYGIPLDAHEQKVVGGIPKKALEIYYFDEQVDDIVLSYNGLRAFTESGLLDSLEGVGKKTKNIVTRIFNQNNDVE